MSILKTDTKDLNITAPVDVHITAPAAKPVAPPAKVVPTPPEHKPVVAAAKVVKSKSQLESDMDAQHAKLVRMKAAVEEAHAELDRMIGLHRHAPKE